MLMNKNWKWLSALFVIITCAMTLSSCSKGGSDDDDPFDPGSGGEEEVWDCVVCGGSGICENCDYYSDPSYCHGKSENILATNVSIAMAQASAVVATEREFATIVTVRENNLNFCGGHRIVLSDLTRRI